MAYPRWYGSPAKLLHGVDEDANSLLGGVDA
jgi:hypothetical protein